MDAQAYLLRHGWRGHGHSLDASTSNRGLKKPLLVSKKIDVLGIGINKHDVVADQWWLKAFDSSLKDFGTGKQSLLGSVREHGVKMGGLYGRFVRGEGVAGTYGRDVFGREVGGTGEVVEGIEKKRKRGDVTIRGEKEDKKARRARKEAKRGKKDGAEQSETTSGVSTPVTDSERTERTERKKKRKTEKRRGDKTVEGLVAEKRAEYERRAKEKGITLDEYFTRRLAKNAAARKG